MNYEIGDRVIVKNKLKKTKMDDEYVDEGTIDEKLERDSYGIKLDKDKNIIRLASQLRKLRGGKLNLIDPVIASQSYDNLSLIQG